MAYRLSEQYENPKGLPDTIMKRHPSSHEMATIESWIDTVQQDTPRRALEAARALSDYESQVIIDLMRRLVVGINPLLGQLAVEYLRESPNGARILLDSLHSAPYIVRVSIVQTLGMMAVQEACETLMTLIANVDPQQDKQNLLVITTAAALGRIGSPCALSALERLVDARDDHLRKHVRASIMRLRSDLH
jgi:HEAT repeat protein